MLIKMKYYFHSWLSWNIAVNVSFFNFFLKVVSLLKSFSHSYISSIIILYYNQLILENFYLADDLLSFYLWLPHFRNQTGHYILSDVYLCSPSHIHVKTK